MLNSISTSAIKLVLKPGHLDAAATLVDGMLASLAASMKDSAYREEQEVRLISYIPDGQSPRHRGTNRGVIPYLEIMHYPNVGWAALGIPRVAMVNAPLPIREIRVGPPKGRSERQRKIGVESLLKAEGFTKVPVNGADIAYLPS